MIVVFPFLRPTGFCDVVRAFCQEFKRGGKSRRVPLFLLLASVQSSLFWSGKYR